MTKRKPIQTHNPPPRAREWLRACLQHYMADQRASKWSSAPSATASLVGHLTSRAKLSDDESDELLALLNGKTLEAWRADLVKAKALPPLEPEPCEPDSERTQRADHELEMAKDRRVRGE